MVKKKDQMGTASLRPSIAPIRKEPEPAEETETKNRKRFSITAPFKWANRPEWLKPIFAVVSVALGGFLLFNGTKVIDSTLQKNQEHQTIATVWQQLLAADVNVVGSPTKFDEFGNPSFPYISFESVRDRRAIHRNLRLAGALPGVTTISLAPSDTTEIGTGFADDSTLEVLAVNFRTLDMLDLSSTKVTTLQPIDDMNIRRLKLINAPIRQEKLAGLQMFTTVTDLWLGWHNDARRQNAIFQSDAYKDDLVAELAKMPNLTTLYLKELKLSREQAEILGNVKIIVSN